MKIKNPIRKKPGTLKHLQLFSALAVSLTASSGMAGTAFYDFTVDPTTGPDPLQITQVGFADLSGTSIYWEPTGGNPGGFLGVTWSLGGSSSIVIFPDIDAGKTVTAFKLEADLRVGNPNENVRAADGFSINFARANDPVLSHAPGDPPTVNDFSVAGAVETGTKTGISIIFDTWQGNTLPDGLDFPAGNDSGGIIVRIDDVTILRKAVPLYNGACTDTNSLQTGPRTLSYWDNANANGLMPDAAFASGAYSNLCWQPLSVEVDTNGAVTVIYKNAVILDKFPTAFFPSAGGLVLAGRTGGADENTHFDNLRLTTTAITADTTPPTVPTNLAATTPVGANHVVLTWTASTDASGRVAYEVERDGVVLGSSVVTNRFEDFPPKASTAYTYRVRAQDVSGNFSPYASVVVTTAAQVPVLGTLRIDIFKNIPGTTVDLLTSDPRYPNDPTMVNYALGAEIGSPNGTGGWNETFGDNLGVRVTGVLTPAVTGQYNFFIRSDDASQFFLNQTGAAIPNTATDALLIQEDTCCKTFLEPSDLNNVGPQTTYNPISLTAGTSYGFVILMKEGGGGDGVGVGMRIVGDTTPAADVPFISPMLVRGSGDPIDAVINITSDPMSKTVAANSPTSFSVTDTHSSAYGKQAWNQVWYQWLRNGVPIPGATGTNYAIANTPPADNNAMFSVIIGVPGLVKTSSVANLTVTADITPPSITSASQTDFSFNAVTVNFSEPVTSPTATDALNYTLDNGVTVTGAVLATNRLSVTLTTSALLKGTSYTLTVNNVQDNSGLSIAANTQVKFKSLAQVLGVVPTVELYTGITGTTVALLTNDVSFPNSPTQTFPSTNGLTLGLPNGLGGWNESFGDNYGMRVTGTLTPPATGQYNFFIRSDDSSDFFLNTNGPALPSVYGTPMAAEYGCCNTFLEPGPTTTQTTMTPISLTAGVQYGYVILMKEGGGGDGVAVGMRIVGDTTPAANVPPINTYLPIITPVPIPTLSVTRAGNGDLIFTFQGTLQGRDSLTGGTWTTVSTTSPATVSPTGPMKFFRAVQPVP